MGGPPCETGSSAQNTSHSRRDRTFSRSNGPDRWPNSRGRHPGSLQKIGRAESGPLCRDHAYAVKGVATLESDGRLGIVSALHGGSGGITRPSSGGTTRPAGTTSKGADDPGNAG